MESSVRILLRPYLSLLIFIAKSEVEEVEFLNEMIRDVNQSHVAEEEWLSDHAYLYVQEEDALVSVMA